MEIDFQHQASRDSHRIAFMMFWKGLISVNQQRQTNVLFVQVHLCVTITISSHSRPRHVYCLRSLNPRWQLENIYLL